MNIEGTEVVYKADYDAVLDRLARAEALLRCAMCNPAQSMMRIGDWEHDATALLVELKERAT